jgi:hypothetical protein
MVSQMALAFPSAALAALALAAAACAAPLPFFGGIWKGGDVKRLVKEVTLLMRGMIAKVPRSRMQTTVSNHIFAKPL